MNTCQFDVLHALVLKGMVTPGALAASAARDQEDLLQELDRLRADGFATRLDRRGVWRITPQGRGRHAELLEDDIPAEARQRLRLGYERFLPLNLGVKQACTSWQLRDGAPNDHADPEYDAALIAELGELHRQAAVVLTELAQVRKRFARYSSRLREALTRVCDGDPKAFTGVMCESYHDTWMELHHDLLLSLKLDRAAEEARQAAGTPR